MYLATFVNGLLSLCLLTTVSDRRQVAELLRAYSDNQNKLTSWVIRYQSVAKSDATNRSRRSQWESGEVAFDGVRAYVASDRWGDVGDQNVPEDSPAHLALYWDAKAYTKYRKSGKEDAGRVIITSFPDDDPRVKEREIQSLRYRNMGGVLMGWFEGSFDRIDKILREAPKVSLRPDMEAVKNWPCYVVDAPTSHGDYTVWLDPQHGYAAARIRMEMSHAAGHYYFSAPLESTRLVDSLEVIDFNEIGGAWFPVHVRLDSNDLKHGIQAIATTDVRVNHIEVNPDHEARQSFIPKGIPDGTQTLVTPHLQITYSWQNGELVKRIDEDVVARIDKVLHGISGKMEDESGGEPNREVVLEGPSQESEPSSNQEIDAAAEASKPRRFRAHCGLYCLYCFLKLHGGGDLDYRELVKPEYYGSFKGSTMAELNRAAVDNGLYAGVATRLSTRALRDCPYQAILHVKSDPQGKQYDHYQLFMGAEDGKARVFNPPQSPKLVEFRDLAYLWDGNALFLSGRPFDSDAIFSPDRQRLMLYIAIGALIVLLGHFGKRVWLGLTGALGRRQLLGVTAIQGILVTVAALVCGVFWHMTNDEGLLANAKATTSIKNAYRGTFIPRIPARQVRRLLETDAVFIDARLASDYKQGHLPKAINVPVDANEALWKERTAGISRDSRFVVYCQSAGCKFAEEVSLKLLAEGAKEVAIFKGGWMQWMAAKGQVVKEDAQKDGQQNGRI